MQTVLKISEISKTFKTGFIPKKTVALNKVSLDVKQGEIFGLLGPNGAGKTTAIKCILGLIHPNSGTIELMGEPIPSPKAQARIGFLTENPYIYDFLTGREYLVFAGRLHGMSKSKAGEKADELLASFHLTDASSRQLRKYSKGMLQRIGLAQALINDPDFLILDEPMSGLDPIGRKEVRDLLFSLKAKGRTILFSSHILADMELLCDHVAILVNGQLQTIGRIQDLLKKIDGYEVTVANLKDGVLAGIPHEVVAVTDGRHLLKVPSIEAIEALIANARKHQFHIESIVPQRQTLEDVYIQRIQ